MSLGDAPYGHIDHFTLGLIDVFGPLESIVISNRLSQYGDSNRGKKLNKWTLAYLAEEIAKEYPGFDLYVLGYFGDGDAEMDFNPYDARLR